MHTRYPCLNPSSRITEYGNECVVSNLNNGRWIRLEKKTLDFLVARSAGEITRKLVAEGANPNEAIEFVDALIEHGFITKDRLNQNEQPLHHFPLNAYLNVTDKCNLSCVNCYNCSHPELGHGLSNKKLFLIIDRLISGGIRNLVIAGGEPMIRPGIGKLLQYARGKFDEISLLTNGTLITKANALIIAHCVDVVHVSLDGPTEKINSVIRGSGNFSRTMKGLRLLKEAGVKTIRIITNINAVSIDQISQMKEIGKSLGVEVDNNVIVEVGRGNKCQHLMPKKSELIRFFLKEASNLSCGLKSDDGHRLNIRAGVSCGSGTSMISVDCRGDVFPCHLFHKPELLFGNLLKQPDLMAIIEQSEVAKQFRAQTIEARKCHGCRVEYFCKGACLAQTVAANAESDDPWKERNPLCRVHREVLSRQIWPNGKT